MRENSITFPLYSLEVADKLALEHYGAFNQNRLAVEAVEEALNDDEAVKKIALAIEGKGNGKKVH